MRCLVLILQKVAPYTGAWIETHSNGNGKRKGNVAPYTGAWIETVAVMPTATSERSHPIRVRGLKRFGCILVAPCICVAPYTGAWIETLSILIRYALQWSHPIRVRGLKRLMFGILFFRSSSSHPIRVRGLKQTLYDCLQARGDVAPYTGAWIETKCTPVYS